MIILQQLKELNLKLPQLFTGSNISQINLIIFAKNSSSCINLIFTNQPNVIASSGTHPLHDNYQHQITFAKATLRVEYSPPYKPHVWDYENANINGINKALSQFHWQGPFTNLSVNERVIFFNSTLTLFHILSQIR